MNQFGNDQIGTLIEHTLTMNRLVLSVLAIFIASQSVAQAPDIDQLFQDMQGSIKTHRTLKFYLKKEERIKGKLEPGEQNVKVNVSPFKTYVKVDLPNKGAELLYLEGQNDGNCLVNPNSFPYMNLNLDPDGSILRKGQHHSVKQLSFGYTGSVLGNVYKKYKHKINEFVEYKGDIKWEGRDCHHIHLINQDYGFDEYTVAAGENIIDIARKTFTNEYMLLEQNGLKGFDSVKSGQKIKVPNSYCKSITMYVDKELKLPIYQKMFDEKGHSATYEYKNVQINSGVKSAEFTKDYSGYGF